MRLVCAYFFISLLVLVAWRHVQPSGFIFYQGIALGLVAGSIFLAVHKKLNDALLVFLSIYTFVFTIPTTVDRSYSVRFILQVAEKPEGLRRDEVVSMFQSHFKDGGGVDRRITEQIATGSIESDGDKITVTWIGKLLADMFNLTSAVFALNHTDE